jgi:pimeloyl-ACP methyl ester carboxylesterase
MLSDSCGYIALSHPPSPKRVIIAFRGTYSIINTIADLSTMPQEYAPYPGAEDPESEPNAPKCENCTVHTGFYTSWANTREVVLPHVLDALEKYPDYAVTLVGHSLGGAVAAFAGLELLARNLRPTITTFGEPRIGNVGMANYLDLRFNLTSNTTNPNHHSYRRVTHAGDPVPLLPLEEWGYMPHAGEIYISKSDLPPSVADIKHCNGAADETCVALPDKGGFWAIPARFKLWQLFFAHRDYFWRLGLCVPTMDRWWPSQNQRLEM